MEVGKDPLSDIGLRRTDDVCVNKLQSDMVVRIGRA